MPPVSQHPDIVIGISSFEEPDARLAAAVCRGGALGVLDLGTGDRAAREALTRMREWSPGLFGVRVAARCRLAAADVFDAGTDGATGPGTLVLAADAPWHPSDAPAGCRVLSEVTCLAEAQRAAGAGAHGLIARGSECGGHAGTLSTFVLLQQLLGEEGPGLPVWACGGIGPRTAAAAVAGGAAGVVLEAQLALLEESGLGQDAAAVLRRLDGTETVTAEGHRMLGPRGGPGAKALPVGEDAFLADVFARRWGSVAGAVRGVREAVSEALCDEVPAGALREGSPMCAALGTRLPVVQGPMTRVSDQPGFAAAVAGAGGLPVLALALTGGEQTRALLSRTRQAVDGAPWGVGLLGFARESIRAAQLDAVRELRPTHAIIAGGRPAQAAALEEAGIAAFLHVPSPRLLRQFLAAGARRFVFEGSECGGHVGPRGSFPLWEAQLGVLAEFLAAEGETGAARLEVLFAGGVHDERSAAMVAALAAPLSRRGAAVGVLMGTAYLFTREAVDCGAIGPVFQRQVLTATGTELLQTAPGHATRCVASPFTAEYQTTARTLREQGVPQRQAWEELERLNLGRLRIAAKGLERIGADLVETSEERQLAAGMFMAGQVAVLRGSLTSIGRLHHAAGPGAAEFLVRRAALLRRRLGLAAPADAPAPPAPAPLEVAIVGMSCMFPRAGDLGEFWANVLDGADAIAEVPPERWDPGLYHSPGGQVGTTPSKWGGFLPPIPFDALALGIPPASLGSIEPVQLLALEAARRALADAGYARRPFDRARAAVIFGAEAGSDLSNALTLRSVLPAYLGRLPPGLEEQLPRLSEDSFPGLLANVIAGRIANRLDLGGANYTVDAACASSLAALDAACKELLSGGSDLVLCGGADVHNGIHDYLLFASVQALSPTGRSRTFDAAADGIALGEGVGCVVLKRLADAQRDGDRVYAVIQGIGSASDGRSRGLTAPRPEGQRAAVERAYRQAGVSPAEVGLLEAHGTGTVVGDRTELAVLTSVFAQAGAASGGCALGSVKSQIGHTKCAAGLAGLIKAALAVHTGAIPPTRNLTRPNPAWDAASSPFVFHTATRPWGAPARQRVAGVSAFGFGGTNFHTVLRGHPDGLPPACGRAAWPAELFLFRGPDHDTAAREARQLLSSLESAEGPQRLRDLAQATARRSDTRPDPVRIALVAGSADALPSLLRRALAGEQDPAAGIYLAGQAQAAPGNPGGQAGDAPGSSPGKVAFLFPGQGSQRPGTFAQLFVAFPDLQRYLELGPACTDALYPPAAFDDDTARRQQQALTDTRTAQPALGMTGLAAHDLLTRAGIRPDMAAGHSYGELTALCAAGALSPRALLTLSAERADAILAAAGDDPGTMAAVPADAPLVAGVLRGAGLAGRVVAANHNAPDQTVIAGPAPAMDEAVRVLRQAGHPPTRLPVACAFHSPLLAAAGDRFAAALARQPLRAPEFPVWANRTAAVYPTGPDAIRDELAAQLHAPVRFTEQIRAMYAAGARVFVEAGPGSTLTGLVARILADRPHQTVACQPHPDAGLPGLLHALARLAVVGLPVRSAWLFQGRAAAPPRPARWTVDGHLVRTTVGEPVPGGLHPARPIPQDSAMTQPDPDALLIEYLRATRDLVHAQRDVLLGYLGAAPTSVPAPRAPLTEREALPPIPTLSPIPTPAPAPAPAPAPTVAATAQGAGAVTPAASPGTPGDTGETGETGETGAGEAPDVLATVLRLISERTGYPVDMLEPGLDLEADLSIDSIKRTEIAGELALRLGGRGAAALDDAALEELSQARTVSAIADVLSARLGGGAPAAGEAAPAGSPAAPAGVAPRRLVVREVPLPAAGTGPGADRAVAGRRFALLGSGAVARALTAGLERRGAEVTTRRAGHVLSGQDGPLDGVLLLGPLTGETGEAALPEAFPVLQAALALRPRWLLCARPAGSHPRGLHGLFRTVAREYPETVARVVALDAHDPAAAAGSLIGELASADPAPVVLRTAGGRSGLTPVESGLGSLADRGAGPAGVGSAEAAALGLGRDSVVVLAGGARGIAAHVALALASACGCRVELLGRTPPRAGAEEPATASAPDRAALRTALAAGGTLSPSEIDRRAGLILAQREVTATLDGLRTRGSEARYHAVDVRDAETVGQVVKEIRTRQGRIDGVIYAAGVLEDRLIAHKDPESFRRVFATKVDGAGVLLDAVAEQETGPLFAVLFGSIAAVLGNRGQCDYAAANDALEGVGDQWAARTGHRALTVHWGPWAPTGTHPGMVSPELGRDYARRGIELIAPEEGALALLRELAWAEPAAGPVVYTASGW